MSDKELLNDLADIIRAIQAKAVDDGIIDALCDNAWPIIRKLKRDNRVVVRLVDEGKVI